MMDGCLHPDTERHFGEGTTSIWWDLCEDCRDIVASSSETTVHEEELAGRCTILAMQVLDAAEEALTGRLTTERRVELSNLLQGLAREFLLGRACWQVKDG